MRSCIGSSSFACFESHILPCLLLYRVERNARLMVVHPVPDKMNYVVAMEVSLPAAIVSVEIKQSHMEFVGNMEEVIYIVLLTTIRMFLNGNVHDNDIFR